MTFRHLLIHRSKHRINQQNELKTTAPSVHVILKQTRPQVSRCKGRGASLRSGGGGDLAPTGQAMCVCSKGIRSKSCSTRGCLQLWPRSCCRRQQTTPVSNHRCSAHLPFKGRVRQTGTHGRLQTICEHPYALWRSSETHMGFLNILYINSSFPPVL